MMCPPTQDQNTARMMCPPPPSGCCDTFLRPQMMRCVLRNAQVAAQAATAKKVDQHPLPPPGEDVQALDDAPLPLVVTERLGGPAVTEGFPPLSYLKEVFPSTAPPLPPLTRQAQHPSTSSASPSTIDSTHPTGSHHLDCVSCPPTTPSHEERTRKLSRCYHLSVPGSLGPGEDQEQCSRCHHLLCLRHLLLLEREHPQPGRSTHPGRPCLTPLLPPV